MDLKSRLSRLSGAGLKPAASTPPSVAPPAPRNVVAEPEDPVRAEKLRRGLNTLGPRAAGPKPANRVVFKEERALPAEPRQTAHGLLHVRERLFAPGHCHGTAPVRGALEADPLHVAALALDPALREADPSRMLLLDTETTGLAGGTGTLPFVIGLGWFEGETLKVQQLVLRRPGEEGPMLRLFAEKLEAASCLVTYNGKTYDWPLLKSRFVMNRLQIPKQKPHLDLLHCARRVFRHRSNGAKLVQLEAEVLGHHRIGDVPGEQIPDLYFRYLRTGHGGLLEPVLEHNAHDMALLAALLGVLVKQFREAQAGDPRDQLGYASVAARAGDVQRALSFAHAAAGARDRALSAEALALAASVARKGGDLRAEEDALRRAVQVASGALLAQVHLELSKLYEHRVRDLARALDHARHTLPAEGAAAHQKRLARLERRLSPGGTLPLLPSR